MKPMGAKWKDTPFSDIMSAQAWAIAQGILIEPYIEEGYHCFLCVDKETETLVVQKVTGGPVKSLTRSKAVRTYPPIEERILERGDESPWIWSPSLNNLEAVEALFSSQHVLRGDFVAYRSGAFIHEYLIDKDDQVYQRVTVVRRVPRENA